MSAFGLLPHPPTRPLGSDAPASPSVSEAATQSIGRGPPRSQWNWGDGGSGSGAGGGTSTGGGSGAASATELAEGTEAPSAGARPPELAQAAVKSAVSAAAGQDDERDGSTMRSSYAKGARSSTRARPVTSRRVDTREE